jgi:hypothetical protein
MRGAAVGKLGAYWNDDGVNLMHDDWFEPMAPETRAFFRLAKEEAPDYIVSLHSHGSAPSVEPTAYAPRTVKETLKELGDRVQKRYADGYAKTTEGYRKLSAHLAQLNQLYGTLKDKFSTLVANLETERKFLMDNMSLQEDSMKVKALVRDGVVSGRDAIGKITEKMATLFLKVDAFNVISEKVTTNMDNFNDFQVQMVGITEQLQQVGATGDTKSLDEAIEQFYNKRFGEEKETVNDRKK